MQFNQTNNGNDIFTNSRTVTAPNVHTIVSEGGERPIRRLINEDNNVCHNKRGTESHRGQSLHRPTSPRAALSDS
jgi:hypothetical protein